MERLTAQDTLFLHLESPRTPMHVGSVGAFEGEPFFGPDGRFRIDDVRAHVRDRLHLVPRFRKRLRFVPYDQGRPVWVDDPHLDLSYHVRLTALPRPGGEAELLALMNRVQSQVLDRDRPLWELWFVEGLEGDRVALIQKTHHCLVDGVSGVDVATVLLDLEQHPPAAEVPRWVPEPQPTDADLLRDALVERATQPAELLRSLRAAVRGPRAFLSRVATEVADVGSITSEAVHAAPRTPWNVPVGPHRRFEVVRMPIAGVRAVKDVAGCTLNDVVLSVVAGGLRRYLRRHGYDADRPLRVMVPVSVRSGDEHLALGNRVAMMVADIPVQEADALSRVRWVHERMAEVKESGQAVGADVLMSVSNFAPPTLLNLACRLVPRQRSVNLVVTNVPGPQQPLYLMGARLVDAFPYVPVTDGLGLTIGVLSYDGQLGFGLVGDRDVMADLHRLADDLTAAADELTELVG